MRISSSNYKEVNDLSFSNFRNFLDSNPLIRTLVLQAINPLTWALNAKVLPQEIEHAVPRLELRQMIPKTEQAESDYQIGNTTAERKSEVLTGSSSNQTPLRFTMDLKNHNGIAAEQEASKSSKGKEDSKIN